MKSSNFPISFMNWEKRRNIHSPIPTLQNPNVESLDEWENLYPNLSFSGENKMGNSYKRGWSHFKLNINDWGIPFLKMLKICQWIGKNIFHWKKRNKSILLDGRLKLDLCCSKKSLGSFKRKYVHSKSKLRAFDLPPPPFCSSCSFYMQDADEFLNEKLRNVKREMNYFFENLI